MFTGIISDIGEVLAVEPRGDTRFTIACAYEPETIAIGASIACSGVCLTATETGRGEIGRNWFAIEASAETLERTTLRRWRPGSLVNLERPLKLGDELGGHILSGHVDGLATIISIVPEGASRRFRFEVPPDIARFMAAKGSVALDGISLTVNEVENLTFGVNVIAHTLAVTAWKDAEPGQAVNVEVDMLARYVARLREFTPT